RLWSVRLNRYVAVFSASFAFSHSRNTISSRDGGSAASFFAATGGALAATRQGRVSSPRVVVPQVVTRPSRTQQVNFDIFPPQWASPARPADTTLVTVSPPDNRPPIAAAFSPSADGTTGRAAPGEVIPRARSRSANRWRARARRDNTVPRGQPSCRATSPQL